MYSLDCWKSASKHINIFERKIEFQIFHKKNETKLKMVASIYKVEKIVC